MLFAKEIFAQRLLELRTSKNISQSQLGEIAGISYFAIGKMEKAQRAASIEVLYALADYFDVSIDYLVGRSNDPTRH